MDLAVCVEDLVVRYGEVTAVDHLSLAVRRGEIFGLLGPNGAGKTTTLAVLEGIRAPDSGRAEVLGLSVREHARALKHRIGVQFQVTTFFDTLTVLETLQLYAALYPRAASPAEMLRLLDLEGKARARVSTLSGGQKQRLAIGTAMLHDPELLFLDEPTTGLDPQARKAIWALVEGFRARGKTVLLTTHYMEEAEALCDRVAVVDGGRVIQADTPAGLVGSLPFREVIRAAFREPPPAEACRTLPAAAAVEAGPGVWEFRAADPDATAAAVQELGGRWGLVQFQRRAASLEDYFLAVTGRALRG
ncbi:ABC transporter ATP-binding protein [Symbiobacterium terraclitae]|uniref:ABC transporter ATP-binding protein n=1 Tax=Symbiobacterium terraclitae TaxID=557451 RepID=UPI0035B528AD